MEEDSVLTEVPSQVHVEWRIKKFTELLQKIDYCLISPEFSLSNAKWCILIYPNGESDFGYTGWIAVELMKKDSATEHRVAFKMGVKKTDGSELKSFHKVTTFVGFQACGEYKYLERATVLSSESTLPADGTLTVFCTARIVNTQSAECGTSSAHGIPTLTDNFKDLFLNRDYADITIKVKNKEFSVHKCIITARSKVFALMFKHDMAEKSSSTVDIVDCDPESFEDFLLFLYTASMDVVSPSNAPSLYKTAHKYELDDLKVECVRCMKLNLSIDTICDVIQLAVMYGESDLMESSTWFFVRNAKSILVTTKWRTLMDENGSIANELYIKALENKNMITVRIPYDDGDYFN